ncbi:MAG: FMN-binding protein [Planctomycetes bacterium]|nr:FMN-binding protein [Planctomycetota bacterium]
MKDRPWFPVLYMFLVTAFFSSIVIGFATFTRDRIEANRQLDFEKSVLDVFGLAEGKSNAGIHEAFVGQIERDDRLGVYVLKDGGRFALPLEGKGFWAPIKGMLGVSADGVTLLGISFFEQNETPGLGGLIVTDKFRGQFAGKKLSTLERAIGIEPFGSEIGENQVHAISGATQTCVRLEKIINDGVGAWRKKVSGRKADEPE